MQQIAQKGSKISSLFRNFKGLYQADNNAVTVEPSKEFQEYVDYLTKNGLKMNQLRLAKFYTRNNLPYLGLQAIEKINGGETLISVPKELMLTTKKAYFSEIQEIFDNYPQFFSQSYTGGWQDRILLAYILYQSQLGRKSQWYHLISNLPKDIDYLIFWDENELQQLNDQQLIINAKRELTDFLIVQDTLTKILDNYPQYFQKETYSYDNIKWIYIHLVSRCFGSSLAQVAFVPFCEMLNHENTNVRYQGFYFDDNKNKPQEEAIDDKDDSDYTDEESEGFNESDYDYPEEVKEKIQLHKTKVPQYKVIEQELQDYQNQIKVLDEEQLKQFEIFSEWCNNRTELQVLFMKIKRWFQENLNLRDNFTIIFTSKCLQYIENQINLYETKSIEFEEVKQQANQLLDNSELYLGYIKQYDQVTLKHKEYKLKQFDIPQSSLEYQSSEEILSQEKPQGMIFFEKYEDWKEDQFDRFIIKCSNTDEYQKNSQVYFSYGKLSNRSLLLRYGFALEFNQYEKVFINVPYIESINSGVDIASYFSLSKTMKFKITYTKINEDLLMYFRVSLWKYEDGIKPIFNRQYSFEIDQAIHYLQNWLINNYNTTVEKELIKLQDKELGYHQYFALVYKIERLRIIEAQIEALQMLKSRLSNQIVQKPNYEWTSYLVDKFINHS